MYYSKKYIYFFFTLLITIANVIFYKYFFCTKNILRSDREAKELKIISL